MTTLCKGATAFIKRKEAGDKAALTVEKYFQSRKLQWHRLAMETLVPIEATYIINDAMRALEANGLVASAKLLRFYKYLPDFKVDGKGFVDAKGSSHIERDAYEHYLKIQETQGELVTIAQVVDENTINMIAVSDIVWLWDGWQYSANGSGMPFNTIHLCKTPHKTVRINEL